MSDPIVFIFAVIGAWHVGCWLGTAFAYIMAYIYRDNK